MIAIFLRDRQVVADGRPLRLGPQFFHLFCLLAYARARGSDRFLCVRNIHRLPRWSKASLNSIGKIIHRLVAEMRREGLDLIESPPRASTMLFRLRVASGDISFDVSFPEVRRYLGLDLAAADCSKRGVENAPTLFQALVRARLELEKGNFQGVRAALREAGRAPALQPKHRIDLLLWSSVLEHEEQPQEALRRARRALGVSARHAVDYLAQARVHIRLGFLGSVLRQPGLYRQAKGHYLQAHELLEGSRHPVELGQIATGLGHLARRENDLESALSYFLAALEYAATEGWAWGIQAGLFNLGLVQAERGDAIRDVPAKRAAYQQAQRWLERAIEFTEITGVGRYSSEAPGVLSHVLRQQSRGSAAVHWARVALTRAWNSGNRKSQAVAHEAQGPAHRDRARWKATQGCSGAPASSTLTSRDPEACLSTALTGSCGRRTCTCSHRRRFRMAATSCRRGSA